MDKKRVLIVDDEENFTYLVKLNLEQTGKYEVKIENKATRAVAAAKEFSPDIIFLDILMPDMGGDEVADKITSDGFLKNIPIVFLTAIVSEDEVSSRGNLIGGRPFIAKPVGADKLIATVEKYTRQ